MTINPISFFKQVTVVSLVPAIAVPMCKYPVEQQYDLSSIRYIFSGAAALSKEVADRLAEKLSCFIFQGYGMTESTMRTHSNFFGNSRDGSIGVVMPFCESKVHPTFAQFPNRISYFSKSFKIFKSC